jgi:type III pantothenate kinase
MLLCIDTGNTNTVFSIWDGEKFLSHWRISTDHRRTADEYFVWLQTLISLRISIWISTLHHLDHRAARGVQPARAVQPLFQHPPAGRRQARDLAAGGAARRFRHRGRPDRLVNTVGAFDRHGPDLIVVDFGTATTFDVVDTDGAYIGGVIAPGVNLSLEALHMAAAALPHVDVTMPEKVIGTNTVACIQSGIFWGYIGLVAGHRRQDPAGTRPADEGDRDRRACAAVRSGL